jgi:hypothetical protein
MRENEPRGTILYLISAEHRRDYVRIKNTSDLGGYSIDTQCHQTPRSVDLVPLYHWSPAQSETIDGTNTDGTGAGVGFGIGMKGYVTNLEGIVVDVCSF